MATAYMEDSHGLIFTGLDLGGKWTAGSWSHYFSFSFSFSVLEEFLPSDLVQSLVWPAHGLDGMGMGIL